MDDLLDRGHSVRGLDLRNGMDIRDYETVRTVVEEFVPDYVYHLAAQTWPRESITDPRRSIDVNIVGTQNLLEALRHSGSQAKILLAGTSEEYGYGTQERDVDVVETAACWPTTPYGVSKLAQTHLGLSYGRQYGLNVMVTRAYNHTGAGQPAIYAVPSFAKRVVAVEKGGLPSVKHGDLSAMRNYTDVRDVVKAYQLAIEYSGEVFNVCSDRTVSMDWILQRLVNCSDRSILAEKDPSLHWGTSNEYYPKPSYAKLQAFTGWTPRIPLEETLEDVVNYWRSM